MNRIQNVWATQWWSVFVVSVEAPDFSLSSKPQCKSNQLLLGIHSMSDTVVLTLSFLTLSFIWALSLHCVKQCETFLYTAPCVMCVCAFELLMLDTCTQQWMQHVIRI